jgi:hypothetical protein
MDGAHARVRARRRRTASCTRTRTYWTPACLRERRNCTNTQACLVEARGEGRGGEGGGGRDNLVIHRKTVVATVFVPARCSGRDTRPYRFRNWTRGRAHRGDVTHPRDPRDRAHVTGPSKRNVLRHPLALLTGQSIVIFTTRELCRHCC